jgi:hypothetical protein
MSLSIRQAALLLCLFSVSGLFAQTGARYLIITNDAFYDAIQPLAQWKQQKGMECVVTKLSQIGTSPTSTQVRSYILHAESTWTPKPEFILLVGAGNLLPAFTKGRSQDRIYTDNPYGNLTGDYVAELPYGRFPCKTAQQCSVMVAKTLAYERTPYVGDTLWFRRGTTAIADVGDGDAPTYWADVRYVAGLAGSSGYAGIDSFAGSLGDDTVNVTNSIDSGTSFVLFRGEAGGNWVPPFEMDPLACNNPQMLPIICSFTCQTEALDQYAWDTMVGDCWLKAGTPAALKGGVAFIGNTHSASHVASVRSAMTRGFFASFFSDTVRYLGLATLAGKLEIKTLFPSDTIEYMGFNLLGDPELNFYTRTPHELDVNYPGEIPVGADTFGVTVMKDGAALANALVCVQDTANPVYQYGYSDSGGACQFVFSTTRASVLNVTATAHNSVPFEGLAGIGMSSVNDRPGLSLKPQAARLSVTPNPGHGLVSISSVPQSVIRVFSASGALVREYPAGTGQAELNTNSLPAGAYVVQASAAGIRTTRLLQIVK